MARVEIAVDPELDAAFPGRRAARVDIEWKDGAADSWLQPTRKGDPDAPLTDEDLEGKLQELAVPVIGAARAGALSRKLWTLEAVPRLDGALA
jgi:2-methylcitrate dehydratase PrpD